MFNAYTDRTLAKTTHTDAYIDGPVESPYLLLPEYPIVSITHIYEGDDELTAGDDDDYMVYRSDAGILRSIGGYWLEGPDTVKVETRH